MIIRSTHFAEPWFYQGLLSPGLKGKGRIRQRRGKWEGGTEKSRVAGYESNVKEIEALYAGGKWVERYARVKRGKG